MKQKQSGRNGSRQTSRIFPGFPPDWPFFFSPFLAPISTLELVSLARGASEVKVARASRGPAISVDFFIPLCGLVSVRYENQLPRKPDQKFLFYLSALVFVCIMQPCTFHGGHVPTIFSNESSAFSALIYYALVIWKVNRRNKGYRNRK